VCIPKFKCDIVFTLCRIFYISSGVVRCRSHGPALNRNAGCSKPPKDFNRAENNYTHIVPAAPDADPGNGDCPGARRALKMLKAVKKQVRGPNFFWGSHRGFHGYPGVALLNRARVLFNSTRVPTRVCGPYHRPKNTALGVFRTPGGVLGTCFAL
jgi:hypothetical protein